MAGLGRVAGEGQARTIEAATGKKIADIFEAEVDRWKILVLVCQV